MLSSVPSGNIINVIRGNEFKCFQRVLNRKTFDIFKRLDVNFVDASNIGEGACDNGGPTREFLRLLVYDVFRSTLFEGPDDSKNLSLSTSGN